MDKIKELEERINRLESKLKENFLLIEKRFSDIPQEIKLPEDINERFNELEDLILLLQVENTKIKDKFTGNLGFGTEIDITAINDKINKVEERIAEISTANEAAMPEDLMEKINKIDEFNNSVSDIRERMDRLEVSGAGTIRKIVPKIAERQVEEQPVILPSKSLLSEINKILGGG